MNEPEIFNNAARSALAILVQKEVDNMNDFVCRYATCFYCKQELPSQTHYEMEKKEWVAQAYCSQCEVYYQLNYGNLDPFNWLFTITTERNFGLVLRPSNSASVNCWIVNTRDEKHAAFPLNMVFGEMNEIIKKRNSMLILGMI